MNREVVAGKAKQSHNKEKKTKEATTMNKVCIVTGGTRGIGLETVKTFLNAGYHVVCMGRARKPSKRRWPPFPVKTWKAAGPR